MFYAHFNTWANLTKTGKEFKNEVAFYMADEEIQMTAVWFASKAKWHDNRVDKEPMF